MAKTQKVKGGSKKVGRSKRSKDHNLSFYVRDKIGFEKYYKAAKK